MQKKFKGFPLCTALILIKQNSQNIKPGTYRGLYQNSFSFFQYKLRIKSVCHQSSKNDSLSASYDSTVHLRIELRGRGGWRLVHLYCIRCAVTDSFAESSGSWDWNMALNWAWASRNCLSITEQLSPRAQFTRTKPDCPPDRIQLYASMFGLKRTWESIKADFLK